MESNKVENVLRIYNDIIKLNKCLDNDVSKLNLKEFTEFRLLKKHLKVYKSKWIG